MVKPGEHWKLTVLPYVKSLPSRTPFAGTPGSPQLITEYEKAENDGVTTKRIIRELHNYPVIFLHFGFRIKMIRFLPITINQLYRDKLHLCIASQLMNFFRNIFHFTLSQEKALWFVSAI